MRRSSRGRSPRHGHRAGEARLWRAAALPSWAEPRWSAVGGGSVVVVGGGETIVGTAAAASTDGERPAPSR